MLIELLGRRQDIADVHFGPHLLRFQRVTVALASYLVTSVPDDHAGAELVRDMVTGMPKAFRLLDERTHPVAVAAERGRLAVAPGVGPADAAERGTPATASTAPDAPGSELAAAALSLANTAHYKLGWPSADIDAAWQGPATRPDAVSTRSGLSLVEMALCVPPAGWDEAAAWSYPWELEGWRPPRPGWTPPTRPAKPERPGPDIAAPATSTIDPNPAEDPTGGDPGDGQDDAGGPAPSAPVIDPALIPELLARYGTAAQVSEARAVFAELVAAGSGAAISLSKANYHAKKLGLPRVSNEQTLQALLAF